MRIGSVMNAVAADDDANRAATAIRCTIVDVGIDLRRPSDAERIKARVIENSKYVFMTPPCNVLK